MQALGRPDLKAILDLCILPVYAAASWWWMKRSGVNGAAHARLMVTIIDCVCLYIFASKLKAFSLRDCASGALFRALLACGGLFLAIFTVQSFHEKLPIAILLALACTVAYVAIFWVIAVDQEDRTTIGGLRVRAFDLLRRRKASPAMQMTGTDVGP